VTGRAREGVIERNRSLVAAELRGVIHPLAERAGHAARVPSQTATGPTLDPTDLFAVRVSGDSMDSSRGPLGDSARTPLRDGDWAVFRPCRGAAPAIARLERAVRPEDIAPAPGTRLTPDELATHFEVDRIEARSGRYGGHLFVFVDEAPEAGGRVWAEGLDRRPGETAFVLAADGDPAPAAGSAADYAEPATRHRYLGVARWDEAEGAWILPG
jgi:hypothetical protein